MKNALLSFVLPPIQSKINIPLWHLFHQPIFTPLTIVLKSHHLKETAGAKKVPLWRKRE
jgi:hypothetical protein